ncbi:double-strand break repair protein AddB [Inquilinus sp. CAU 1745]|uniref:double-strand break repair protein AddB n=1 Tax=Inquilinus sp. CAU 1745 TaxID=3140369 RepID=UPI00325C1C86
MRIFTIPSSRPFLDALAKGILDRAGDDPRTLGDFIILLPTRRACRSLREAFLRLSGGRPMLLPRMNPIGDLDEESAELWEDGLAIDLPPAIPALDRRLLLARLIMARADSPVPPDQAAWLAADLARLLDQVQTEGLGFDRLATLAPDDLAKHWQVTLDFLKLVTEHWPAILAERGEVDPAERRNRLLGLRTESWLKRPPAGPVIAAGSTGSIPATAALLKAVAGLPQGAVVLPGLDQEMDDEGWDAIDESHPQFGLKKLIGGFGLARRDVAPWPASETERDRSILIRETLRPAATTEAWQHLESVPAAALEGLKRIDSRAPDEEAATIAIILRQTLETPGRTAALVTPDRGLARRVASSLARWGVEVDDSAGRPLAETAVGAFLRLATSLAAEQVGPLSLLALLKHPLAAGQADRRLLRALELLALRGPRPAAGFEGLRAAASPHGAELTGWLERVGALAAPFLSLMTSDLAVLPDLIDAHIGFVEGLAAADGSPGADILWRHDDGEAAASFLEEARAATAGFPPIAGRHYPRLFEALMADRVVRPRYGSHPRLSIWGPLEARLQCADTMILAGLNEGTWPAEPAADPWMSRPMRQAFGLPSPERRIGLAAHDFAQLLAGPEVVLSRAARVEGAPTVPSRWLLRLDTVLARVGARLEEPPAWADWAQALDRPERVAAIAPPSPRPPVEARPRKLRVSEIGLWMTDPYAIYARHILKLRPLDPLEADPGAADRGTIIHSALSGFLEEIGGDLPEDSLARLLDHGQRAFGEIIAYPGVRAFWWPRFVRIAEWFVDREIQRRHRGLTPAATEIAGNMMIGAPAGRFALTARADRIDRDGDGGLVIIDYKTGAVPSAGDMAQGYSPQLPLEAAMAREGGFGAALEGEVAGLEHWRLTGNRPAGEIKQVKVKDVPLPELIEGARSGFAALVARFDDPATPYLSFPRPAYAPRFSDYAHLARVQEWSSGPEGGEA